MMIKQFFCFCFFFFTKSALFIRSGKFLFGLVKKICLPDRMSGKDLNTFANTELQVLRWQLVFVFPLYFIERMLSLP